MASRSHVDVNERRLRPIYDCLDNGNNKKAIQEADKVLKKQKDLQCAKVLKALALLRLGRQDESSVLLQGIHAQNPTDEATLQAMVICYRETHKLELIADLYGNAHKNKPDNEEILSSLFMAYVRLGDYKKQQQTAMSLHRLQPQKNPYYFWAVMSIVMQGHASPDKKLAKTMFLPLAERMAKRYVDEEKISSEAEVQLYLIILEMLEKSEEALNVIKGPLGEKLTSEIQFQDRKAAELYRKLERWPETNAAYKSLLKQNPDHWEFWQEYISSCMKLSVSGWTPTGDLSELDADYTEDMAAVFIEESIKNQTNGRLMRGPYLARLELTKQMRDLGQPKTDRLGSPQKLLEEYYQLFGDKCCCFDDMRMFTDLLSTSGKEEVIQTLSKSVDLPDIEKSLAYASSRNQMQRHLTSLQLSYHIGMYDNYGVNDRLAVCREFICRYQHGLQFGKDLLTTDIQFSDNYLLLAVYILISLWEETGEVKYLWQAIVQLEKGTKNSPSNFRIKVLLIRLYCIQGVYGPSHKLYESLEAKHIMNDTLGHIVANHVGRLGFFAAACSIYGTMLRFFAVNHKETAEYLLASYKYGSFNKICEFVKFREKLQNSLQYACATVESMLLDLVQETDNHGNTEQIIAYMEIDPAQDKTHFDDVCDNRDFTLMASWTPTKYVMKDAVSHSFKEEKAWLKVRNLTLRILAGSVILGQQAKPSNQTNNGIDHDKKPIHEVIQDLSEQLAQHVQWCQEEFTTDYEYPLQGPFRTRLSKYLCDSHSQVFHAMVQNVQYLYSLQEDRLEKTDNEKEEEFKTRVPDLLTGLITKHSCSLMQKDGDRQSLNPSVLENLVFTAETLSHATVMAGVCHRILKPLKSAWNKKSRKQKGDNPAPLPCTFGNFSQLLIGMEKAAKELHLAVRELDPIFLSLDLSSLSLTDSLQDSEEDKAIEREMWKKVESSYQVSSREVSEFVHNKMQYLNSLKL